MAKLTGFPLPIFSRAYKHCKWLWFCVYFCRRKLVIVSLDIYKFAFCVSAKHVKETRNLWRTLSRWNCGHPSRKNGTHKVHWQKGAKCIIHSRRYVKIDTPSNKFNFRRRLQISRVFMHVWSGRRDAIATTNVRPGKKEPRLRRQFIRSMSEIRSSFLAAAAIQFPTFLGPILPLLFWNPTPLAYPLHFSLQHYKCNLFVV